MLDECLRPLGECYCLLDEPFGLLGECLGLLGEDSDNFIYFFGSSVIPVALSGEGKILTTCFGDFFPFFFSLFVCLFALASGVQEAGVARRFRRLYLPECHILNIFDHESNSRSVIKPSSCFSFKICSVVQSPLTILSGVIILTRTSSMCLHSTRHSRHHGRKSMRYFKRFAFVFALAISLPTISSIPISKGMGNFKGFRTRMSL